MAESGKDSVDILSSSSSSNPSSGAASNVTSSGSSGTTASHPSSEGFSNPSSGSSSHPSSGGSSHPSSGSQHTEDSATTVDIVDGNDSDGPPEEEAARTWGRLLPLNERLYKNVLLQKDLHAFGRGIDCDYTFEAKIFKKNTQHFQALSKVHFRIFKENHSSDPQNYTVFLEDKSSNGTFVNAERVGSGKKTVMKTNDEISLATKKNKAFIFFDLGDSESEQDKYPSELNKKYTITKILGMGACGEVRLAFEKETYKRFAVKIISKRKFSVGPKMPSSTIEEVTILRKLDHPGIVKIGEVYDSDDALYIILELVCGGELFDRVRKVGQLEENIAKLLFYQMLLAVNYLHERGITHRDLKPENVLLTTDSLETAIKITDFGLSRFVGENSLMKTLCGTPNYLAPEILKTAGTGGYSKAVDCWSLGCILYVCLGGYPPFSSDVKDTTLFQQILDGSFTFPDKYWKHVSAEAKDLIDNLLKVDHDKRISVAAALKHPWLQDEDMKLTAENLMNRDSQSEMPPPPIIPAVRKTPSAETEGSDSPESKRRRLSSEETDSVASSTGF